MGSPISSLVEELVMQAFEDGTLIDEHRPKLWLWYVDDTFVLLKANQLKSFHTHLNLRSSELQLTCEVEKEGSLGFLDVLLSRKTDSQIGSTVYCKPTHKDKILDYNSWPPIVSQDELCKKTTGPS